jgi:solute carrier family 25 (adenine nucleotide translocator) protein 4/5/6/31
MKRSRQEKPKSKIPEWRDAMAGACAGAFSKTAMAPIERVKLLLQLQGSVEGGIGIAAGQSSWKVALHVYEKEGIWAFWRGNLPNVLRTTGQAALNFALMDYYKNVALSPFLEKTVIQHNPIIISTNDTNDIIQRRRKAVVSFVSGGLAGGTATTVLYPAEFLRTRLAMDHGRSSSDARQYRGMKDVVIKTFQADGIRGLYQGYGIALWGSVLYRLLFLGGYDAVKTELQDVKEKRHDNNSPMTLTERFMIAQTVSLMAGTLCYPIDSVRRRLMMQAGKAEDLRKYRGSIHCFRLVWAQEGLRGFYLGLAPNLVRSIGGAVMLVAYDMFKVVL